MRFNKKTFKELFDAKVNEKSEEILNTLFKAALPNPEMYNSFNPQFLKLILEYSLVKPVESDRKDQQSDLIQGIDNITKSIVKQLREEEDQDRKFLLASLFRDFIEPLNKISAKG